MKSIGEKVDSLVVILWLGVAVFAIIRSLTPSYQKKLREYYALPKEEQRRITITLNRRRDPIIMIAGVIGIIAGKIIGSDFLTFSSFMILLLGIILAVSIINLTKKSGEKSSQDIPTEQAISIEDLSKSFRSRWASIALE